MTAPAIGVLALQGDVAEHLKALEAVDARACSVRTEAQLDAIDGLVLPGGESTTIVKLAEIFALLEPLRSRIALGLPVYGSCAGMILLADDLIDATTDQSTFGGIDMTVRRNAFGRQVDSFEAEVDVTGIAGGAVHAVFIRAPRVERVGDGVEVLARIADGPGAGSIVAVRQGLNLATSFHPELTGDLRMHRMFVDSVRGNR